MSELKSKNMNLRCEDADLGLEKGTVLTREGKDGRPYEWVLVGWKEGNEGFMMCWVYCRRFPWDKNWQRLISNVDELVDFFPV